MMRSLALVVLLILNVFLCGCSLFSGREISMEASARSGISRAWREHIDAALRKDLDGVVAMYADDVVYSVSGSPQVVGRSALRSMEEEGMKAVEVVSATHKTEELRVFGEDVFEIGTVVGPVRLGGAPAKIVTFHYMALWQKGAGGEWLVRHLVGK